MTTLARSLHFAGSDMFVSKDDLAPDFAEALEDCGAPGPADACVAHVMQTYEITGDPEACREMLKGYGAWEDEELEDHNANLERLVWLTGCGLAEGAEAYFSAY